MASSIVATDPVIAIRARIRAVHDAMEAAPSPKAETRISKALPALWSELEQTTPTTNEGAALLIEEACNDEDALHALPFSIGPAPGQLFALAGRVRQGHATACTVDTLRLLAKGTRLSFGQGDPMGPLLENAAGYLATRH